MPTPRDSFKDFCLKVVTSEAYRSKLQIRLQEGTLHPSMESLVIQFAVGKPSGSDVVAEDVRDLTELTNVELMRRCEQLMGVLRKMPDDAMAGIES